jgi:hypothetical protein
MIKLHRRLVSGSRSIALSSNRMLPPSMTIVTIGSVRVVLCVEHQSCYTSNQLEDHLRRQHRMTKAERSKALLDVDTNSLANCQADVPPLLRGSSPIAGLAVTQGFECTIPNCGFFASSWTDSRKHVRSTHTDIDVKLGRTFDPARCTVLREASM